MHYEILNKFSKSNGIKPKSSVRYYNYLNFMIAECKH